MLLRDVFSVNEVRVNIEKPREYGFVQGLVMITRLQTAAVHGSTVCSGLRYISRRELYQRSAKNEISAEFSSLR